MKKLGESLRTLGQNTRDQFRFTGERAVSRRIIKRINALSDAGKAHTHELALHVTPSELKVYTKPGGDSIVDVQTNRKTVTSKLVIYQQEFAHTTTLSETRPIGRRRGKPEISVTYKKGYTEHTDSWDDISRKKKISVMREFGLIPDPTVVTTVRRQKPAYAR